MTSNLVWQGFAVGFLAAIPLGPMGMVCVQRTLVQGRVAGLVSASGLTAAAALWCVVATQGLSAMVAVFAGREAMMTFALGVFLVGAGVVGLVRSRRQMRQPPGTDSGTLASHFVTSLMGVILNPITFVTMTAVLAIMGGINGRPGPEALMWLAVAFFAGGMTLWLAITHGVALMRDRLGESGGAKINQTLNGCILIVGIFYLVRPFLPPMAG